MMLDDIKAEKKHNYPNIELHTENFRETGCQKLAFKQNTNDDDTIKT